MLHPSIYNAHVELISCDYSQVITNFSKKICNTICRIINCIHALKKKSISLLHQSSFYSHDSYPCQHGQTICYIDIRVLVINVLNDFFQESMKITLLHMLNLKNAKVI